MSIPFDDFGGPGRVLHFAHANGYSPACYQRFLAGLARDHHVIAMRQRPLWPGSQPEEVESVQTFVGDMLRFFDQEELKDVIGVGHSLGAVVTMYAALERPELFQALVLIEPIFLMPTLLEKVHAQPPALSVEEIPVVRIARSRRNHWPTRQAAFGHFRPKRVFSGWSDDVLWDYIRHGFREREAGGVEMVYSPEWEAHVYTLMLIDMWKHIPRIEHPTLAMRGVSSDTLAPAAWELWRMNQPQATFVEMPGTGHLLTMEEPQETSAAIRQFVESLPV